MSRTFEKISWFAGCISTVFAASSSESTAFNAKRYFDDYCKVTTEYVTPHADFGKKTVWRGLDVLMIVPAWGAREVAELMQRFDFRINTLMYGTRDMFNCTDTGWAVPTAFSMSEQLQRYDRELMEKSYSAIVFGNAAWAKLPDRYRMEILRRVYNGGTGLVLINPGQSSELDQLFRKPDPALTAELKNIGLLHMFQGLDRTRAIQCVPFGKGRVLRLNWESGRFNALSPWKLGKGWQGWEYDHNLAFVARAILLAAGKDFSLEAELSGDKSHLRMTASPDTRQFELRAYHAKLGREFKLGSHPLEKTVPLRLEGLPNGDYLLLVTGRTADGTLNGWDYQTVSVHSPKRIESVKLDKRRYGKTGEPVRVDVVLADTGTGDHLMIRISDANAREVYRRRYDPGNSRRLELEFPAPFPLTGGYFKLETELFSGGMLRDAYRSEFMVGGRPIPSFTLGTWAETDTGHLSGLLYGALAKLGVDYLYWGTLQPQASDAGRVSAENNLMLMPAFPRFEVERIKNGNPDKPVHRKSLMRPEIAAQAEQQVRKHLEQFADADIMGFTDGSDVTRRGNSYDADSIACFRKWLEKRYGSIEKLNALWKTRYGSFEAVTPPGMAEAAEKRTGAAWIEFNRFNAEGFLNYYIRLSDMSGKIARPDGKPRLGPDGFGRLDPFDFADFYDVLKKLNYFNLYYYQDPPQIEICRSILRYCPQVSCRTIYDGSYAFSNYTHMRTSPWYMLLHGYNGYFYFFGINNMVSGGQQGTLICPDGRITEGFAVSKKGIDRIRSGIGELVEASRRLNSKIGILYCYSSIAAAAFDKKLEDCKKSLASLQSLLEDCGLQYDYIPVQELEKKDFPLEDFRTLILPHTFVLTPEISAGIRHFADRGGLVLADMVPGKYDFYLNDGPAGEFRKRFGTEPSFQLLEWMPYRLHPSEFMRKRFMGLTADHSEQRVKMEGTGMPRLEKIEYETPDGTLVAAFINYTSERRSPQIKFPAAHVYELVSGKHLGYLEVLRFDMGNGETKILAFCKNPVKMPEFRMASGKKGEVLELSFKGPQADSVVSYTVLQPDLKIRKEYSGALFLKKGEPALRNIHTALNDPEGKWQIVLCNEFDRSEIRKEFELK
ncbi:MAG: Beta-galactosidase [Lentisphaerae bacterium ADurb.Bin242]|nr:MAG: Beta-galactosidase [Lentisphaerae bacterium ADurb.Bin242]